MDADIPARSYGCSLGCGNPYDFVVVQVVDSNTLLLCTPCYVKAAMEMVQAILDPDNPDVQQRIAEAGTVDVVSMGGRRVARRGHEAPGDLDSPGAIETFETFVLEDELPDDMRPEPADGP